MAEKRKCEYQSRGFRVRKRTDDSESRTNQNAGEASANDQSSSSREGRAEYPSSSRREGIADYQYSSSRAGRADYQSSSSREGRADYQSYSSREGRAEYPSSSRREGIADYQYSSSREGRANNQYSSFRDGRADYQYSSAREGRANNQSSSLREERAVYQHSSSRERQPNYQSYSPMPPNTSSRSKPQSPNGNGGILSGRDEQHNTPSSSRPQSSNGDGLISSGRDQRQGYQGYRDRNFDRSHSRNTVHSRDRVDYSQQQPSTPRSQDNAATRAVENVDKGPRRQESLITSVIRTEAGNMENKHGRLGQEVQLLTNYFKILKQPNFQLYQYHVNFSPDVERRGLKLYLLRVLKEQLYLFVGAIVITKEKLKNDVSVFTSDDRDGNTYEITITFTRLVPEEELEFIFNLILRKSMAKLGLQPLRRNYFDAEAKINLPEFRLQLLPGYITSIRPHEDDILLCTEITTKVMRSDTVLDIMKHHYRINSNDWKKCFEQEVLGMIVITDYNNKTYRIDDVDYTQNPTSTFERKNEEISFLNYYKQIHSIHIQDETQPLLISRSSERDIRAGKPRLIALIPELCRVTGLSNSMRKNFQMMKRISNYKKQDPGARIQTLLNFNRRLQQCEDSVRNFREWNVGLGTELVRVPGRVLANERIVFGNRQIVTNFKNDWSKDVYTNEMLVSQHLTNWVLVYPNKLHRDAKSFVEMLQRAAKGMRYTVNDPHFISIWSSNDYGKTLNDAANRNPQLIMCFVDGPRKDSDYKLIKKICSVERGIPSQVIAKRKTNMSIATKVLIQINCKLGGVPWMVNINQNDLMVIGFDVCRYQSKTYGAIVATIDMKSEQNYFSAVNEHKNGEGLSNFFGINLTKAITAYKEQHQGNLPGKIIIYRAGVGDGQIQYVMGQEVNDIRSTLQRIYNEQPFKLGFVIVSKKINTRFFTNNRRNPCPGTVVDRVVTLRERYEFFLVQPVITLWLIIRDSQQTSGKS